MKSTRSWLQLALVAAALLVTGTHGGQQQEAEVLWDSFGVPHIFADTIDVAVKAFGWFTAKNHGDLTMRLYGIARGRASEYWGAAFRPFDLSLHAQQHVQFTETLWEEHLDDVAKGLCHAFAEGFNEYVEEHEDEFGEQWLQVMPVSGEDVFLHAVRLMNSFTFAGARTGQALVDFMEEFSLQRLVDEDSTTHYSWQVDYAADFEALIPEDYKDQYGSNTMAVDGKKGDGAARLIINPHLPYFDLFKFTEAHMVIPGFADMYGTTLVGLPALIIGFTDQIGWSHTVNTIQGYTQFRVDLDPEDEDGMSYLFDGESFPITQENSTFLTKGIGGRYTEHTVVVERTRHGIIYSRSDTQVLVAKLGAQERVAGAIRQYVEMTRARDMDEFVEAMRMLNLGFFTTCAASADGEILNSFNGWVPDRSDLPEPYRSGDWDFWKQAQNGSISDTYWTDVLPWDELPHHINPESGYTQNANEPPWMMSLPPLDPTDYEPYVAPAPFMSYRSQISMRLLEESDLVSFDDLVDFQLDTSVEAAAHVLDELLEICDRECNQEQKEAAEILRQWDRHYDNESPGGLLFLRYLRSAPSRDDMFSTPWSKDDPLNTPHGIKEPGRVVSDLQSAMDNLARQGLELDAFYGSVFRLPLNGTDSGTAPGNGGRDTYRNTWYLIPTGDGQFIPGGGDTFVASVEFGQEDGKPRSRAQGLIGFGNASQGPHQWDQMQHYSDKVLRTFWKDYDEILEHTEHVDVIHLE